MEQPARKHPPRFTGARSRITLCLALVLALSLALEVAPAEARPSRSGASVNLGAVVRPFAAAAKAVGSWLGSVFVGPKGAPRAVLAAARTGEVPEKRTATTRTIRNPNGSYTLESFTTPIHYRDADENWQLIDNTLVDSARPGYAWRNKANGFGLHFKERTEDAAVAIVVGTDTYQLSPQSLERVGGSRAGDEARYPGVAPATDLVWRATETGLKETLTLRGPAAPTSFTFLLSGPVGSVTEQKDGSFVVTGVAGKRAFTIDAPWAQEHAGVNAASAVHARNRHATVSVAKVLTGYEITLSVEETWLRQPGRRFPVTVDPTLTIQPGPSTARETYVIDRKSVV